MQTFVVTGASKGIGFQTSIALANLGHKVLAIARNKVQLDELAASTSKGTIIPFPADLSSPADRARLKNEFEKWKNINGLVNNAAVLQNKDFDSLTVEDWRTHFELNLFSIVALIKMIKPHLANESHIVNIGSMGGFQGSVKFPGLSAYSASKAALANLTESLAVEFAPSNICVNCLALGAVSTEMQQAAFPDFKPDVTAEEMGKFVADFTINNRNLFSGQIIPVAGNNPT